MGHWIVDGVKNDFCTTMDVSGPANKSAWETAKTFASEKGVTLNLGSCSSNGYDSLVTTVSPKTFHHGEYTAEWNGKVWSK